MLIGLTLDTPQAIAQGLLAIVSSRDTLITDYMGLGGIGAAFVHAGLLTLLAIGCYHLSGATIGGASVACLMLVLGFGLFGKSLINVWFIVFGVWLFARYKGEPFAKHINTAFFGAALAPIFTEILFSSALQMEVSLPLAAVTTVLLGFVLVPVAANLFKAHMGHTLYNIGWVAGIVGTVVVAVYKGYGFVPDPVFIWTTGNNRLLGSILAGLFAASAVVWACFWTAKPGARKAYILRLCGRSPTDFVALAGIGPTLLNMGLTGAIGTAYVLLVGGDLNGPTIGAIFTIVGFSAFGKHPKNILPIMTGVFIASLAAQMERERSVAGAGGAVRHHAGADCRALRLALGPRRRLPARLGRADGRPGARRPGALQQRLRGRAGGGGAGAGDPVAAARGRGRRPRPMRPCGNGARTCT